MLEGYIYIQWEEHCVESRKVPGSMLDEVILLFQFT
jgi:hypothetical protein